jgi:Tectonin domain
MSNTTYSLTYSSMLTEDFIHTDSILASSAAPAPLATFLNSQGQSEALVVFDDGELCHLQREPLSSSGWNFCGIDAEIGAITAADRGSVWMITQDQNIWMTNTGHWNYIDASLGGSPSVSAGNDGTIYAVANQNNNFHLFTFDVASSSFIDQGIVPIHSAPAGTPGSLWSIAAGGKLFTNSYGSWHEAYAPFAPEDSPFRVDMSGDGSIWIHCSNNAIYTYDPPTVTCKRLTDLPAYTIGFAAADAQTLYVLTAPPHEENRLFTNATGSWEEIAFPATPITEISVGNDGVLWARDISGRLWIRIGDDWIRQIMPTDLSGFTGGRKVTEVVTGKHNNGGIQYAFFVMENDLYWTRLIASTGAYGGYWERPLKIFQGCSTIAATNDPSSHELLVYGVSSKGNFLLVQDDENQGWKATEVSMKTSLINVRPQFVYDGGWLTYAIVNNQLYVGKGSLKSPGTSLSAAKTVGPAVKLQTLIPFSMSSDGISGTLLAALDTQNQLWLINGNSGTVYLSQLSDVVTSGMGAIHGAVAMLRPNEGARIYARDINNMLWIIRQTAATPNKAPQPDTIIWSEWHPLGNDCLVLASGCTISAPGAPYRPPVDLFSLDSGYEVNVLSEDPVTGVLTDLVMLKPDGTNNAAEYVTRYVSEIAILDENSAPPQDLEVSITADEAVGIWVGATLYHVSPQAPALLRTDQLGKLTFAFFAADLHTPTFFFEAAGLESPPALYPARTIHDYLAGSSTAMPNRPVFTPDGSVLRDAQMQTGPSWNTPATSLVESNNRDKAPAVASAITSIYTFPVTATGPAGEWTVAATQPTGVSGSNFWHDLCRFPHDIEHAIKKDALKVKQIVVKIEERVVAFTMELANGLQQILHLAINTFRDIVSAVKSAFRYIERGVEEVIHWLKSLFNWTDILNTKRVLEASLNGVMTKLADNLDSTSPVFIGNLIDKYFDQAETVILDEFDKAKAHFEKKSTFSQTANSVPYPEGARAMGNDPLYPSNTANQQNSNSAQTNYVHTHVVNYSNQGGSFPPTAMGDGRSGDSVIQILLDAIEKNLLEGKFRDEQMKTVDNLKSIFSDPKNFANVVMYDILTALEDVVDVLLKVIQSVLDALLSIAGNALKGIQDFLNHTIDIPVISYIYKEIAQHPLTLMDLFCLIIAVPATLLYKLTFGLPTAKAPFDSVETGAIVAELNNPAKFPWPVFPGTGATISANSGSVFTTSDARVVFIPAFALATGLFSVFNDMAAAAKARKTPVAARVLTGFSVMSILAGIGSHLYGAPFQYFNDGVKTNEVQAWLVGNWASKWLPIILDTGFTAASNSVAKLNDVPGIVCMTAAGTGLLIIGAITSSKQYQERDEYPNNYDVYEVAGNILAPVPRVLAFLIKGGVQGALGLAAVDAIFTVACGTLSMCSAFKSS